MRVETRIFGQQGRVDIEHPAFPASHELGGQDAHISSKNNILRARIQRGLFHRRIMLGARHALVGQRESRDTFGLSQRQRLGLRIVRCHQADLVRAPRQPARIKQRRHIRPPSGNEDRDPRLVRHYASPTSYRARTRYRPNLSPCSLCHLRRCGPRQGRFLLLFQGGRVLFRHWRVRPPAPCRRRS